MKIMIAYPPLESEKGIPLLTQNRQFQWFNNPCYIYPVVPATAASLLKKNGYDVVWLDGIAEKMTTKEFIDLIDKEKPDLIAMETKTPVVKRHWKFINDIKRRFEKKWGFKIVLMGDHVTAMPLESFEKSKVDFVITGGDYDFSLKSLVLHLDKGKKLEAGIYFREKSKVRNSGPFELKHNLDDLPFIDRELTKWKLYAYDNGNFKKTPGTYIMAGRDCWWGKCKFCSWTTIFPKFRVRSVKNVLDEIGELIKKYKIREIMDDTGTFPCGKWLEDFCRGMIRRGYNKKVIINCNMRARILNQKQYDLMGKAGFRFLLYGLESANQKTLDKINKGVDDTDIVDAVRMAKQAGLAPHVTCMVGYPWETKEEAIKTVELTKMLFAKGWIDTLQATITIPYPGTPLFKECDKQGLLRTKDWDKYDMRQPIMKSPISDGELKELTQGIYKSFLTPRFVLKKISSIRSFDDIKFFVRAGAALVGHLTDFKREA